MMEQFIPQNDVEDEEITYLCEPWHGEEFLGPMESPQYSATWRLKERMKTAGVALVLCLNLGTDPPDVIKPVPCARRECWFDPVGGTKQKKLEIIGNALQQQYEKWQGKAKYKQCLDPTSEDLRRVCINLRKAARNDRLLFHYNGHGVPMPTKNGELWLFGKHYTHYMPVAIYELKSWLCEPAIYVLDCSCAGALLPHFIDSKTLNESMMFCKREMQNRAPRNPDGSAAFAAAYDGDDVYGYADGISYGNADKATSLNQGVTQEFYTAIEGNIIVLAACQANQILPMNPLYPADVFTSCLTTPLPIALRWFILQTPFSMQNIDPGLSENIPGKDNDRKTPKGELNWVFTAITDTIAWTTLPSTTFQKIFRQDLLVASLFRNFLLAKRIMKSFQCTPQSWPPLPDSTSHPLWNAWDLAAENCLMHVAYMQQGAMMVESRNNMPLGDGSPTRAGHMTNASPHDSSAGAAPPGRDVSEGNFPSGSSQTSTTASGGSDFQAAYASSAITSPPSSFNQSSFFADNLTAFGMWLDFGGGKQASEVPMHLPILLQVLLSQTHRLHALVLLRKYLALGLKAVNLALLVGIFPYILKLLQSPTAEIKQVLVCIWASIIGFDSTCRVELVREKSQSYFVQYLTGSENPTIQRCMAAFVLAELCNDYREGQQAALQQGLHRSCVQILSQPEVLQCPLLKRWICLCIYKYCEDFGWSKYVCLAEESHTKLYPLLEDPDPTVRASAVLALGEIFGASDPGNQADGITSGFTAGSEVMGGAEQQQILLEREQELAIQILESCTDGSVIVRKEALIALSKFVSVPAHTSCSSIVVSEMMRLSSRNSSGAMNFEGASIGDEEDDARNPPWILSASSTQSITDTVARHLSSSTLLADAVVHEVDRRSYPEALRDHAPKQGEGEEEPELELKPSPSATGADNTKDDGNKSPEAFPMKSRNALMAAGYVGLWLALLEVHGKDPHPEVCKSAAAIINWMYSSLPGKKMPPPPSANERTPPRQRLGRPPTGDPSDDSAPPLSPRGLVSEGERRSPGSLRGKVSPKRGFMGSADAFDAPPPSIPTPEQLAGAIPLEPPNDFRLHSHLYNSLKQMFLTPSETQDSSLDPLSKEGGERLYRTEVLNEVAAREKKLKDLGVELMAMAEDPSPYSKGGNMLSPSSPDTLNGTGLGPAIKNTRFEQRTILNIDNADMTSHVMFHSFLDVLAISDGKDVGIWNLQSGSRVMSVRPPSRQSYVLRQSHLKTDERPSYEYLDRAALSPRITAMQWVNESHDALLMLGADNGTVTLWRDSSTADYGITDARESRKSDSNVQESTSIASCFFALPDVADTSRGSGLVMSWQQTSGTLVVGGNSNTLRLWDLGREQCVRVFNTGFDTCTTALASRSVSSEMPGGTFGGQSNLSWTFAGFADGSIAVFDERVPGSGCVSSAREHSAWVVGAYFRPDTSEIITGSVRGSVKFWDLRTMRSVKTLEVHKSPLTALAVHPHVPILATGSHAQFIKILTLGGEQLGGIIKYHDGFLGQRIGPVSCLAFHPNKMMLATGATDSIVSVYQVSEGDPK